AYPDLPPGATAASMAPYELYVDPSVACGTPIVLRLAGHSNEGDWRIAFPMHVGDQVPAANAFFNSTAKSIPDLSTVRSFINVADPWVLTDVDVSLSID